MEHENGKRKGLGLPAALGRCKYVLLVAALGALLLLWPSAQDTVTAVSPAPAETDTQVLSAQLADILSKIRGVGRAEVMLTLQSGDELVLASDSTLRYSGSAQAPDSYDRSSEVITISGGTGSGQDVVVTQRKYPQYRGALVVCEGGGNDGVRLQVAAAVSALTGLGSDRIAVVPWQDNTAQEEPQ